MSCQVSFRLIGHRSDPHLPSIHGSGFDDERSALQAFLKEHRNGTEMYCPLPMHLQTVLLPEGYGPGDFRNAEQACSEVLSLPIFPEMLAAERDYVTASIKDFIFMKGFVAVPIPT